jgi:hypothetical protein
MKTGFTQLELSLVVLIALCKIDVDILKSSDKSKLDGL